MELGFTASDVAMIREQVDTKCGSQPRMIVHDVWIEHVRMSSRQDVKAKQIVYEVFDCRGGGDEETFGTFIGALNRVIELLK